MALRHLTFFDKQGHLIDPTVSNGIKKFDVFFDPVSTGLFESQHLFMFEEVLVEKTKKQTYKFESPKQTLDIQILKYLYDYNDIVYKDVIQSQFPTLSLDTDYVENFMTTYSAYVEKDYEYDREYYYLNENGRNYVTQYDEQLRELEYAAYNINVDYVHPRSSYAQKEGDDINEYADNTFIFFKWRNTTNEKNIFLYLIDYNPTNFYHEKNTQCFNTEESFPTIVPIYDNYLSPTSENPNWKLWFAPYQFDDGRNDAFEYNRTPIWTQEGYVDDTAYPKVYDAYGRRVFPGRRILNSEATINKKPFQINFAIHSETEGTFQRTLEMYAIKTTRVSVETDGVVTYQDSQSVYQIAEVNFYGEVVAEDERLEVLLENFGRSVDESELYVFRDVDIDDERPNYIQLNEKRKELLLASQDIFPYLGSYKSFVNVLKFFGYHDIRLKEYFINTIISTPSEGKIYYSSCDIPLDLKVQSDLNNIDYNSFVYGGLVDDDIYYKSSRFGLFYDINKLSGEYDADGWPIVEDAFQYTNEEILIKLYGLKQILEQKYLAHNVRIINITGEGIYFAKIGMNSWQDQNPIIAIKRDINPEFTATPLKGYIKPLDILLNIFRRKFNSLSDTGYFDKDGNFINEPLNQFTKLENIIHCSLYEFIQDGDYDFPFDYEVPLEIISEFFPTYFALKSEIYNHLRSTCDNRISKDDVAESVIHTIKMLGQPVVLSLIDRNVTWEDLPIRYEYVDTDRNKTFETIEKTWDNIGKYNGFDVDWIINHVDGGYCYHKRGAIEKHSKILIFLPKIGFYDVVCTIKDNTNFPAITKKNKYIEVLATQPDFIAFGRCVDKNAEFDLNTLNWESASGAWDMGIQCPIQTTWNDADISWDSLFYDNYFNQNFVSYIKENIYSIDYDTNTIELANSNFYDLWQKKKTQYYRDVIVLEKPIENIEERYNYSISLISPDNKIVIPGQHPLKKGDKINLHKYTHNQKFVVDDNGQILLTTTDWKDFVVGKFVNLYTIDKLKKYSYEIIDVQIDFITNIITLSVNNDGSLNELNFAYFEYNSHELILTVTNAEYVNGNTTITVSDPNKYLVYLRRSIENGGMNIENLRLDYCFLAGYYPFKILKCDITTNGHTSIKLAPNPHFCDIDIRFSVKYDDYDIDWSLRNATSENYSWENLECLTLDDGKYQSWDTLEYVKEVSLGFRITQYRDSGSIFFNGSEFQYDIRHCNFNDKWYKLAEILNATTHSKASLFEYHVIENRYIQATAKTYGKHALMTIETSLGTIASSNTYPLMYFNQWENEFFNGDNNPAMWSVVNRVSHTNAPLENGIIGSFNYGDTFIAKKEVHIPKFTTLFILFDKFREDSDGNTYYWELWDEKNGKLLSKSSYNYLIWNFVENGVYSVYLKLTDINGNVYQKEKKSWIYVSDDV